MCNENNLSNSKAFLAINLTVPLNVTMPNFVEIIPLD